jgi:type IV pilus assembly protein PilW
MVSLTIGLAVLGGVLAMLTNSMRANAQTVSAIRLNQEMRAAMDLLVREVRRAGYLSRTGSEYPLTEKCRNFAYIGNGQTFENFVRILDGGARMEFQYDADTNCELNANDESFGFKLEGGTLKYTRNALDATPDWQPLTDPNVTTITALSFCYWPSLSTQCLTQVPPDAKVTLTGTTQASVYAVRITMSAQIRNDATSSRRLTETIRVRNDRFDK